MQHNAAQVQIDDNDDAPGAFILKENLNAPFSIGESHYPLLLQVLEAHPGASKSAIARAMLVAFSEMPKADQDKALRRSCDMYTKWKRTKSKR